MSKLTEYDYETISEIAATWDISRDEAKSLYLAAEPLWEALADLGWVDGWGGNEYGGTFPATLAFIHYLSNADFTPDREFLAAYPEKVRANRVIREFVK